MKTKVLTLIFSIMICNLQAQKVVYELSTGSKEKYEAEDINICFAKIEKQAQDSGIHESSILAIAASAIIPTVIKAGFKLSDSLFAKNVRKYKAEYFRFQSYLDAGVSKGKMPDFQFLRKISFPDKSDTTALEISFKAEYLSGFENAMVYYIDRITLNYASAKIKKNEKLDYTITLTPVFYLKNSKKQEIQKIAQINIHSVGAGNNEYKDMRYRTEIIILPEDACFLGLTVNIAESNPRVVKANKYLDNWNTYKDDIRTGVIDPLSSELIKHLKDDAEEEKQWNIALSKNTEKAYSTYLEEYPIGKYSNEAKAKIKELKNNNNSIGEDEVGQD